MDPRSLRAGSVGFCDGLRFMGFVYVGIEPDGILWYDINIEVCRVAFSYPEAENMAAAEGSPSAGMGAKCTGSRRGKSVSGQRNRMHGRPQSETRQRPWEQKCTAGKAKGRIYGVRRPGKGRTYVI